ncbi:protocadherin-16-like [Patella vulgata]|uniref:protocadherin-16-like n=1 Tax=Patella vulgata TaxID=6465 RepID=UPI0024A94E14|nr:protocadherin-16-like [Patella vulgata]
MEFSYQVVARNLDTNPRSSNPVTVTIQVLRNNNPPIFQNEPYSTSFTSQFLANAGQRVFTVTATDADTQTPLNQVQYRIIGEGVAVNLFNIDANNGIITTRSNINTDGNDYYRIYVVAEDGGIPALIDTAIVYVNVTRNLNSPVFNPTIYRIGVPDIQTLGTPVTTVSATDADTTSPQNRLEYRITGEGRGPEYFRVNQNNGEISVYQPLYTDTTNPTGYNLTVNVRDLGNPSRQGTNVAQVFVTVQRNLFAPSFTTQSCSATITRSVQTGTSISRVTVSDQDQEPFNRVTVDIIGDETAPSLFSLDTQNNIRVINSANLALDSTNVYSVSYYLPIT